MYFLIETKYKILLIRTIVAAVKIIIIKIKKD